jgi:ABC-type branched-subunit amino acid transport system substrate-binding protein
VKKSIRVVVAVVVSVAAVGAGITGASAQGGKGTIKVGTIVPIDAEGLSLKERADAVEAGIKGLNRRGGVNGQKMEWVLCDTHGDPNTEAECARQMVEEGVVATISDQTSTNGAAVSQILGDAGIARIAMIPTGIADYQSPVAFPNYAGPVGQYAAVAKSLIDKRVKKLAIVVHDLPAARALPSLLEPMFDNQGGELVTSVFVPAGVTDYSPFVAQLESAGAEGALLLLATPEQTQMVKAMNQLDWDGTMGSVAGGWTASALAKLGDLPEQGVFAEVTPTPTDSPKKWPGLKTFLADLKALDKGLTPAKLAGGTVQSWLGVVAFVNAMKGVDDINAASVLQTFNAVQDIDMLELMPPWTPSAKIDHSIFKSISNPTVYAVTWDGKRFTTAKRGIDAYALFPATG